MLCHNCKKNEADKTFVMNMMGTQYEAHMCNSCLEQMWQYALATGQGEAFKAYAGWWPGMEEVRKGSPFPLQAAAEVMQKRRLSALRARLEDAAKNERYEEAAELRDALDRESEAHT